MPLGYLTSMLPQIRTLYHIRLRVTCKLLMPVLYPQDVWNGYKRISHGRTKRVAGRRVTAGIYKVVDLYKGSTVRYARYMQSRTRR